MTRALDKYFVRGLLRTSRLKKEC